LIEVIRAVNDVLKKAQELADAIRASEEYQRVKAAEKQVEEHHAAKVMLRDFQRRQSELQKQEAEGRPITEEQQEELRKLQAIIAANPYVRELLEAEFAFAAMLMQVQDIILEAVGDKRAEGEQASDKAKPTVEVPKKKIWTPGS